MQPDPVPHTPLSHRVAIGLVIFMLLLLAGIATARAGELVTSIGYSKTALSTENQTIYSVTLRGKSRRGVLSDLAVGYRDETFGTGEMSMRTIPVTISGWYPVLGKLYMGGGYGYYFMRQSYAAGLSAPSVAPGQWGYHYGGGLAFPMGRSAGIDMQYRWNQLKKQDTALPEGSIDPSFWSASAGLVIRY